MYSSGAWSFVIFLGCFLNLTTTRSSPGFRGRSSWIVLSSISLPSTSTGIAPTPWITIAAGKIKGSSLLCARTDAPGRFWWMDRVATVVQPCAGSSMQGYQLLHQATPSTTAISSSVSPYNSYTSRSICRSVASIVPASASFSCGAFVAGSPRDGAARPEPRIQPWPVGDLQPGPGLEGVLPGVVRVLARQGI